jgi:hypothetical protein
MKALPSDGWKSRKIIIGLAVLLLMVGLSFAMLFMDDVITSDQLLNFWQILVPSVLVPLMGALGLDKLAEAKANGQA